MVSIIVVNHNGKKYLKRCFDSLLRLNFPKKQVELIMVDNSSRDDSVAFIKKHYPRTVIIENEINNYCRANNLGIQRAKGEFVALLNNDTKVEKDWLAELVKIIVRDKTIAAVGSKVLFMDGRINSTGHMEFPNYYWTDRGIKEDDRGQYDQIAEVDSISGVACLYRRKYLQQIGLFDEDFQMFLEDVDISLRLKKRGKKMLYCPRSIVYHVFHGSASDDLVSFYIERNRLLLLAKHYPEQLGSAVLGSGYFTLKNSLNGHKDIYQILPVVFAKLLKHHNGKTVSKFLPDLFANLRKSLNLEKYNLTLMLENKRKDLQLKAQEINRKDSLLSEKDANLSQLNSQLQDKLDQIQLKAQEINHKDSLLSEKDANLSQLNSQLQDKLDQIQLKAQEINHKDSLLSEKDANLSQLNTQLQDKLDQLQLKTQETSHKESVLREKDTQLTQLRTQLQAKLQELSLNTQDIARKQGLLREKDTELKEKNADLAQLNTQLQAKLEELSLNTQDIARKQGLLREKDVELKEKNADLAQLNTQLQQKLQELKQKDSQLSQRDNHINEQSRVLNNLTAEFKKTIRALDFKTKQANNFEQQISDFYSTETFKYVIRPLWKTFDLLKAINVIRPRQLETRQKLAVESSTLLIKPQQVSVEQTEKILHDFKTAYPQSRLVLMANLLKVDYERLSQNKLIDEKLFYNPFLKKFGFREQLRSILELRKRRFDTAVVLVGESTYPGYARARILALLSGAKKIKQQPVQQQQVQDGRFEDTPVQKLLISKDMFKQVLLLPWHLLFLIVTVLGFLIFIVSGIKIRKIIYKFKK
ncbi:glycosyltransferase [Candidatus Omnitrophota bacterium]